MATLVLQIPSRNRLRTGAVADGASRPERAGTEYRYVLSLNGLSVDQHGQAAAALLPKADNVVAMLADADIAWHRIPLPKAPAARLRAALGGVLEEALLDDAEQTHFALAPQAVAGQPTWIAAVNRRWLAGELAALEKAHVFIDRVVPAAWPDELPSGHFAEVEAQADGGAHGVSLTWSHPEGVVCLRLQGALARSLVPQPAPPGTRWSSTPGAAAAAEQWLGAPVNVMAPPERLLQAARTLWNLRQFELARRNRGMRALRDGFKQWRSPAWRPVRYGAVALVAAQLIGLNLWAWSQKRAVEAKRVAAVQLLQASFPNVRAVLDAPLQMNREVQTLRTLAGKPGDTDLEPMLQAAAAAWPPDRPPVENLRFEPGKLSLAATGWDPAQVEQFRGRLRPAGWQVDAADGRVVLTRAARGTP